GVSMRTMYVFGHCDYETNGIYHLLPQEVQVVNGLDNDDILTHPRERDVLILCLSALPLLRWGRQLSKIEQLVLSCDAKIIVLTPNHVPCLEATMHSKRVFFINGTQPIDQLHKAIMGAIRRPVYYEKKFPTEVTLNHRYYRLTMDIINEVSIIDRAEMERLPLKTAYHHRSMFIKQLGFSSLQHLQMFLTDINQKDIKLLCSSIM
ncbi:MAG: hypothetical protein RSD83_15865, partial [Hafnia sp.]|uniref:hypothetical protein n=1 Tax=Hafnia sp. TaxID=1873498 RepID=UPI002FC69AB6